MTPAGRGGGTLLLLGLCPMVAPATTLRNGLAMGAAALFVLVASALAVHACRRLVLPSAHVPVLLVVTALAATVADLVLQAAFHPLRQALGLYLPLLAMNVLLLSALESGGMQDGSRAALKRTLWLGLAVFAWVTAAGALRELLADGTLAADRVGNAGLALFAAPAGAFLVLGGLAGLLQCLRGRGEGIAQAGAGPGS